MAVIKNIHHINFVVSDLETAVQKYEGTLGIGPFELEDLPGRGVSTGRARVGDAWIVLVCPHESDSVVGRYLEAHGEGFFLLSFGVDNLDEALQEFAERGAVAVDRPWRSGILGWKVADLETEELLGANFHLTELG